MFGRIDPWMLSKRYTITLKNGEAFEGMLERRTKDSVLLQQATVWNRDGATKLQGRIILERSQVLYYQESGPPNADQQ